MRKLILAVLAIPALLFAAGPTLADESRSENPPAAAEADAGAERAFTPPPGFREKKRGEFILYCRREEPKGTRFPQEVCYDEKGIREMLQTQREDQMKVDQIRKTQATTNTCCE